MSDVTPATSLFPVDALFNNPLFAGGIGLAGLGAAATLARRWAIKSASLIKRRLLVDLEISKQDHSYQWILKWLMLPRPRGGFITENLTRVHHMSMRTIAASSESGATRASFMAEPGYGTIMVKQGSSYISVSREKHGTANLTTGEPHETLTLTTLYAHRNVFADIFREALQLEQSAQRGKTVIYKPRKMDGWVAIGEPRRKRPLNSVILDRGIKERIVADVQDFLERQQWYIDRGIPYRRGYLLYGPPGSGKTSFVQALAGEMDFGVAIINLSERGMNDDKFADLLTKVPSRTILLLEDSDAAFVNRRAKDADGYGGGTVTFSGLLNALDGVAAGEERICFLTTNHIDRLDPALIRPGRVDMTVHIGEATRYQAAEMWDRFYGEIDKEGKGRELFLQKLEELNLVASASGRKPALNTSTAAIQGLFLFNKEDMASAIEMAEGLIPRIYEPKERGGIIVPA